MRLLEKRTEIENEKIKMYTLLHRFEFKNSAKFRQTFSHVCNFMQFYFPKLSLIVCNSCPKFTNFDEAFPEIPNFSKFHGKDHNLLISQKDFATKVDVFRKWFSKVRQNRNNL